MFKYIKKLTSVVVMFAVIIVFSSSNVYAVENQTYNPLFRLFAAAIKLEALDLSAEEIYEAGADYIYMTRVETARSLENILGHALAGTLDEFRINKTEQHGAIAARQEVLT